MTDGVARVVRTVAARENTRPERLPPLEDAIDADCLDRFFAGDTVGLVSFEYCGYTVTYHSDGSVELDPAE